MILNGNGAVQINEREEFKIALPVQRPDAPSVTIKPNSS